MSLDRQFSTGDEARGADVRERKLGAATGLFCLGKQSFVSGTTTAAAAAPIRLPAAAKCDAPILSRILCEILCRLLFVGRWLSQLHFFLWRWSADSLFRFKRSRSLVFRCQGFFPRCPCFVVHRLDSIEKGNRITQDSINVFYDVRDYFENPRQDFHFFLFDGPQILFSFAKKKPTASFTCLFIVYQLNSIEKGNRITQESLDVLYDASDSL